MFSVAFFFLSNIAKAEEVYRDNHVRFTLIDEGTIRLEYAPDGKFVDNKSFVAVIREYGDVPHKASTSGGKVVITTSKFKLSYKKDGAPLNAKNLTITSTKALSKQFTWKPGTEQKENLKGTYRTLDGYDGNMYQYSNPKHEMPLEDGLLATDGWTLIDDSKNYIFDGAQDWDWVTERKSAEGAQDWYFMAYGLDYKGNTLTNLAIKGLFKRLSDDEVAALEADGYTAVNWGQTLLENADEYYKYLFYDYDYETAPIHYWPFTPNVLSNGGFTNGYGFAQD
jgi:hypothetical protein